MSDFLVHAHSGWRWIILILLLVSIVISYRGWKKNADYENKHKKIFLFTLIAFHLQLLGGLILYFDSSKVNFKEGWMKEPILRFFGMEHILMMVVATALITIAFRKHKTAGTNAAKFKKIFVFYFISLILVLASIPWPFRENLGGSWF